MTQEHIITREMLIATLADVMKERDHAKRELDHLHDDYSKSLTNNTKLRESNERFQARIEELAARAERAEKNACTCNAGPGDYAMVRRQDESLDQSPEQRIENLCKRLSEQASEIERLKRDNMLLTVKLTPPFDIRTNAPWWVEAGSVGMRSEGLQINQRDRWIELVSERNKLHTVTMEQSDEIAMLHGTIRELRANSKRIGELQAESDKNAKAAQLAEQEVRVLRGKSEYGHALMLAAEIKQLKASQCQCVSVLEEKLAKLQREYDDLYRRFYEKN